MKVVDIGDKPIAHVVAVAKQVELASMLARRTFEEMRTPYCHVFASPRQPTVDAILDERLGERPQ